MRERARFAVPESVIADPLLTDAFWAKADQSAGPAGCWPWTGARITPTHRTLGYGRVRVGGESYAHRLAWMIANGRTSTDGRCVLHSCDNAICVNPAHLDLGTDLDNARQREARRRCRHARGRAVASSRLSEDDVTDIRSLRAFGADIAELASAFGVSRTNIHSVVRRETWRHLP